MLFRSFYIVSDYEDKNQLLIYWSYGVNKLQVINQIIQLSLIFVIFQIIFSTIVIPYTQDKSRSYIRTSNLDFFPNLIKPKKFIDTVKGLTIFIDEKNEDGSFSKILLKDETNTNNIQIIIAEKGNIILKDNKKLLLLNNGEILKVNKNNKTTSFNFRTTQFNLENYSSKTTKTPKVQEIATIDLIKCFDFLKKNLNTSVVIRSLNCNSNFLKNIYQELFKRMYLPVYIALIGLIASLILLKSKNTQGYFSFKIKIFLTGIFFIILSDILLNYTGNKIINNLIYTVIPVFSFLIIYEILVLKLRKKK